jgi:two-component system, sensor histidine kinase and response regulator
LPVDDRTPPTKLAEAGFAAMLSKPVKNGALIQSLEDVMRHGTHQSSASMPQHPARNQHQLEPSSPELSTQRVAHRGSVLVVDDNIVNQKVAQRFLQRMGCTVTIAGDGAEAIRLVEQQKFDLILMDLQMPVMDGCAATRRIRELEGTRIRTPIVALSADVTQAQLERARAAGIDDYLTKPIEVDRLQAVLQQYLENAAPIATTAAG